MPPALLRKPEVSPGLDRYLTAFWDLTSERQLGAMGGCGSIPWTAIDRYAARQGLDDLDDFERFRSIIRAMDGAYLAHVAEVTKPGKGKGSKT